MDIDQAIELCRAAVVLCLTVGAPVLLVAVVVGLVVSIFQAVTQLQDQTLSFVPKILAMIVALLYLMPWVLNVMMEYSTTLFHEIPQHL